MSSQETPAERTEWILEPRSEYRFELDPDTSLAIRLVDGRAEIFGAELAVGRTYLFGAECRAAVFTWHGCKLEISKPSTEYISDETPMVAYSNIYLALEQKRILARRQEGDAPRVMIIGPENSGKTSATKILTNYAVRGGIPWAPMLVNLDPSEGGWTVPGNMSACSISAPIPTSSPAHTLGSTATSAPTSLASSALVPLAYWFGHTHLRGREALAQRLIRNLAESVEIRLSSDEAARASGVFIDTPSSFAVAGADHKYTLVQACVEAFRVNVILVIGHEKLLVEMQRLFGSSSKFQDITIVKVPKSGGVVDLDHTYKSRIQAYQQRAYFYGTPLYLPPGVTASSAALGGEALTDLTLSPYSSVVGFNDISIYRIGGESMAPSSALPIGAARVITALQPMKVDPSQAGSGILNALLALLSPLPPGTNISDVGEGLIDVDVAGYLLVSAVDLPNKKMTILSPSAGSLTGRVALAGSLEWVDQ